MTTPKPHPESEVVRITLTIDIPVEEILAPDPNFASDSTFPSEVQARFEREQLLEVPDSDEELLRRIVQVFSIRDAVHVACLEELCREVTWQIERP